MSPRWKYYSIYGIDLKSDIDLPGVNESVSGIKTDVTITYTEERWPESEPKRYSRNVSDRRVELLYPGNIYLRMTEGNLIEYMPLEGVSKDVVRQFLLCNALGVLLHQRKIPVLHASAVDVGGKAILFLGNKGQGKSTTAAAFYAKGYGLVSDDIVPVFGLERDEQPYTYYGPQQLRLLPDALKGIFGENSNLYQRVETHHNKIIKPLGVSGCTNKKIFIHSILILSSGDEINIENVSEKSCLFNLISNLYTKNVINDKVNREWTFRALNKIRNSVSCGNLIKKNNHSEMVNIIRLIEKKIGENE